VPTNKRAVAHNSRPD